MNLRTIGLLSAFAALSLNACASKGASDGDTHDAESARPTEHVLATATAQLESRSGTNVTGTVNFTELEIKAGGRVLEHRVVVSYDIQGLPPGEARGFHIHEHGDCSAPDAMSAGGHFNPGGHDHGAPDADDSHAGDLGNVTANQNGRAVGTTTVKPDKFTVVGDLANNIVGKSVIIHVATDDYVSQPTGDAGPRAACGVIEVR